MRNRMWSRQRWGISGVVGAALSGALASVAVLAAPAGAASGGDNTSQIGHTTSALCAGKTYTIGYDAFSTTAPGTGTFLTSLQDVAHSLGCVTLISSVNNADPATAAADAQSFVSRGVSAAILFNAVTAAASGQLQIFKAAKIPVIQFGAVAPGAPTLVAPEFKAGNLAGTQLAKAFKKANPGKVPYILAGRNDASGQPYIGYMTNFINGAKAQFSNYPKSKVISVEAGTTPVQAQTVVRDALGKVPPSAPVILMGDDEQITQAMLETVLQQSGRSPGSAMTVNGRGQTATVPTVCSTKQMVGMVNYFFSKYGNYLMPLAILQAQGKTVPKVTTTKVAYQSKRQLCS